MRRLAIAALMLALITAYIGGALANGAYTALVEDANLKISLNYPSEVKARSCFTVRFQASAFTDMTIDHIKLKITYFYDSASNVIYNALLVDDLAVSSGWVDTRTINVCLPDEVRRDPFLEARVEARYIIDSEVRELSNEWFMAAVRDPTYAELASRLDEARRRIRSLENRIADLLNEIDDLMTQLDRLQEQLGSLAQAHETLSRSYENLQERYNVLQQDYQSLNEEYRSLLAEYEALRARFEDLSKTYGELSQDYQALLRDHQETVGELRKLNEVYGELKSRYEGLREKHDAALSTIGSLENKVSELESQLAEKEAENMELRAMYNSALNEGNVARSILYAQSAAVAGVGAGILLLTRRRRREGGRQAENHAENGNGRTQRILSGRRVTLPKEAMEKLGLKEGGRVIVQVLDDGVRITPANEEKPREEERGEETKP